MSTTSTSNGTVKSNGDIAVSGTVKSNGDIAVNENDDEIVLLADGSVWHPNPYPPVCHTNENGEQIEDLVVERLPLNYIKDEEMMASVMDDLLDARQSSRLNSAKDMERFMSEISKRYKPKTGFSNSMILYSYRQMVDRGEAKQDDALELLLRSTVMRSLSGVMVIAVFTSPYPKTGEKISTFSCPYDCHYCPSEPGQPKSYLLNEPGVKRANRDGFIAVRQFWDRAQGYYMTGHQVDKIELLILGGTWSSYPEDYQEEFIRDLFFAANTFFDPERDTANARARLSVEEEQRINETARCRIIGLTIETRPDQIWKRELRRLRRLGVTRVQLGVQHTDDAILEKINRQCTTADAIKAFRLLKDCCFKIDMHIMPDLPGSDPQKDKEMFDYILHSPDLQADQWKIYPCETTPWTKIKEWYDEGLYKPYNDTLVDVVDESTGEVRKVNPLLELLVDVKAAVHPWIRLNRVIRDIPKEYIFAGNAVTNLRQVMSVELRQRNKFCRCIRCREVKGREDADFSKAKLVEREYEASGGRELFLSFEAPDPLGTEEARSKQYREMEKDRIAYEEMLAKQELRASGVVNRSTKATKMQAREMRRRARRYELKNYPNLRAFGEYFILGFLRLRLTENAGDRVFPELHNCALIRELHVYGRVVPVKTVEELEARKEDPSNDDGLSAAQHVGFGTRLMRRAEEIALTNNFNRIAVIAGVGTREYYRKRGYKDEGHFLIKDLTWDNLCAIDDDRRWRLPQISPWISVPSAIVIAGVALFAWKRFWSR